MKLHPARFAARFAIAICTAGVARSAELPLVTKIELQPLAAQVARLQDALDGLGAPLRAADRQALSQALISKDAAKTVARIQEILDAHCLLGVNINPEMRVKVARGPAAAELDEQGWRVFLVKVANESGTTAVLKAASPNAQRLFNSPMADVPNRWLDLAMFDAQPLSPALSGLDLEYRIIQLYSRDVGKREAKIAFNVGQGTQDLGFRNEVDVLFTAKPARGVTFRVKDENGQPTTATFVIKDRQDRIYPAQGKRLAPDFAFHPQVYRADGEIVKLPDGVYQVIFSRGPESIAKATTLTVNARTKTAEFKVERWIDPSKTGWWSGDHHIHAAGCAHYVK